MTLTKKIKPGSISATMLLEEELPLDFPARVEISYCICIEEDPSLRKGGNITIIVTGDQTIEQMWEAIENAINIHEGIV